jgi:uncharacterized Ntn-hydrolase superfamily protein
MVFYQRSSVPPQNANRRETAMRTQAIVVALLGILLCWVPAPVPEPQPTEEKIATFSIAAVDREAGTCGAAVASMYPAVAKTVAHARADVGAFCTQHYGVTAWGPKALDLLADGKLPEEVVTELLKTDKNPGGRQLGIIDMQGRSAQRHPVGAGKDSNYWGGMSGRFYVCQGNTLAGRDVITGMAKAFEETKGSLADRLLAALIAGDCAGGDHRGRLAAGIRVCKKGVEGYWLDLHVDKSSDAVIDLAKQYADLKHDAKGEWEGAKAFKHPCLDRPAVKKPG